MSNGKGFNITKLDFLPSEFYYYNFKKLRVKDLSISQVTNLSILNGAPDLLKMIEIYSESFVDLSPDQVSDLLYIDFITCAHYINHLTFGVYNNSFNCTCPECGEQSKVEYNLYSLEFKVNKVKENLIKYGDINIYLKNFTVGSMGKLLSLGLEEDKNSFLAICIDSVFDVQGELIGELSDFESARVNLDSYPYRLKELLSEKISGRYPSVKPLEVVLKCKHKLKFIPDMTLKGLPQITSI